MRCKALSLRVYHACGMITLTMPMIIILYLQAIILFVPFVRIERWKVIILLFLIYLAVMWQW